MKKLLIFSLLLLFMAFVYAEDPRQEQGSIHYKHSISLSYGLALIIPTLGIEYEHQIKELSRSYLNLQIYGHYYDNSWDHEEGALIGASFRWLTGKNTWFHLELGLGAAAIISPKNLRLLPDAYCGFRLQRPGEHLYFNTAIGYPKLISQGIGWAF